MRVQGTDVPKPVITFDEAGFPSMYSLYAHSLSPLLITFHRLRDERG
jgi:hypothetical protein